VCDCICDDNPCDFLMRADRTCRKVRKCSECYRQIDVGERYHAIAGRWRDSGFGSFAWCVHCQAAWPIVERLTDCDCICFRQLWEHADESKWLAKSRELYRLYAASRRKWRFRRGARSGQLMPLP